MNFADLEYAGSVVLHCMGKWRDIPRKYWLPARLAMASMAEVLAGLVASRLVPTIEEYKTHLLRISEARAEMEESEARAKRANAMKLMAQATEETNAATHQSRKAAEHRLEMKLKQAEVDRKNAESRALERASVVEAQIKLMDAVSRLRQAGGDLFLDEGNLKRLMQLDDEDNLPKPK